MLLGRIRAWQRGWHGRSKIEKVEFQSMAMWHAMPWIFFVSWGSLPLGLSLRHEPAAQILGWALIAVAAAQSAHANRSLRQVYDHYLKRVPLPRRDLAIGGALLAVAEGLGLALQAVDGVKQGMLGLTALYLVVPFGQSLAFALPIKVFLSRLALFDAVIVACYALMGARGGQLAGYAALIAFGGVLALFSARCGAWTLSVMWEADRAREVEARLAVAEERLRFGRDLHDVMGRNLAVIALKSELAVQLARRGRPEAVDQMVEVQRIAQETQREVREVVRGYREIDLGVELTGAQGVLEAAGIRCRVTGSAAGLSAPVQSVLAWVVREAATNVLRHGDARRCDIVLAVGGDEGGAEGRTTLVVENDGVDGGVPGAGVPGTGGVPEGAPVRRGTGLAGLRERLAAVGGTLEHTSGDGVFRLSVDVPAAGRLPGPEPESGSEPGSGPEQESGSGSEPGPGSEQESGAGSEPGPGPEQESGAGSEPGPGSGSEPSSRAATAGAPRQEPGSRREEEALL
ncbi:histidine kinase [Streptomyces sp. NPDC058284]|uniref:histidine kinase n=1 Tax=unclassified Streptomyces TaxID=2593676 RepID=UPI003657BF36